MEENKVFILAMGRQFIEMAMRIETAIASSDALTKQVQDLQAQLAAKDKKQA